MSPTLSLIFRLILTHVDVTEWLRDMPIKRGALSSNSDEVATKRCYTPFHYVRRSANLYLL